MNISKKILFSVLICVGFVASANADYIDKFSLPYVLDALTDSQIKDCESIHNDFITLSDVDFYTRYQNHQFSGNCVMLYEDSIWDYEGSDRYEKLSQRSTELIQETEMKLKQRRANTTLESKSLTELQIPGTFLFKFQGCTGDQTINASDISVVSDMETVLLTKFVADERVILPGTCNLLEVQIKADDPSSIKVVIPSLDIEVSAKFEKEITKAPPIEFNIPSKVKIVTGDLSHKAEALNDKDMKQCENINQDFQKLDENDFNTRYLYHKFVGDCVLLFEDPIWEIRGSVGIDEINQRLDELKNQKEISKKGEFRPFSITPLKTEEISEGVFLFSFEGCTGDEFVNVEKAVAASDIEVLSLVPPKREGNILPPDICRVLDIKIHANDPSSIRIVLPMVNIEGELDQPVESQKTHKSPRAQIRDGIVSTEVICKEGFELLLKTSDGSPACVKRLTAQKLIERGWQIP